jgi:hypothetical protein
MNLVKPIRCVVSPVDSKCVVVIIIMFIEMLESLAVILSCVLSNSLFTCVDKFLFCFFYIYIYIYIYIGVSSCLNYRFV